MGVTVRCGVELPGVRGGHRQGHKIKETNSSLDMIEIVERIERQRHRLRLE
jgi:hypothetical protein